MTTTPASIPGAPRWPARLRNLALVAGFNTGCAVLLLLLRGQAGFWALWVFSQCIGLSIYAGCVLAMRVLPTGRLQAAGVGLAVLAGVAIGWQVSGWLLGLPTDRPAALLADQWPGVLALSAAVTAVIIHVFHTRQQIAQAETRAAQARAEAAERAERMREAERGLLQARLKALQAQIEPHFLFNSLANLRSLIARDPERALDLLDRLNAWLRATLTAARADHSTLADEFALLDTLLRIHCIRLGERLRVAVSLPDALAPQPIAPMLIQPLVENALRHGIEPALAGGSIELRARQENDELIVEVADTGIGLRDTGGDCTTPDGAGTGLENVRERLQALYGGRARLEIESPPGGGVVARLRLPLRPAKGTAAEDTGRGH